MRECNTVLRPSTKNYDPEILGGVEWRKIPISRCNSITHTSEDLKWAKAHYNSLQYFQ